MLCLGYECSDTCDCNFEVTIPDGVAAHLLSSILMVVVTVMGTSRPAAVKTLMKIGGGCLHLSLNNVPRVLTSKPHM